MKRRPGVVDAGARHSCSPVRKGAPVIAVSLTTPSVLRSGPTGPSQNAQATGR